MKQWVDPFKKKWVYPGLGTYFFILNIERPSAIHFVGSEENRAFQGGNLFIQTLESLPHTRNFRPEFEFQTLLGAKISRLNLGIIFLLSPTGIFLRFGYSWRFFWGISLCFYSLGFTILLFSWVNTPITKRKRFPMIPLNQSPTIYITYLILEIRVGWKILPNLIF